MQIPGVGQQTLQYLTTEKQMSDERVRQAVNFAFDRKTLLETVFQGAGRLLWIDAGFNPDDPTLDHYDFNPDKAKQLLADAAKDGKYDPNTPVSVIYSTQQAGWNEIAAALDADLTAIGMKHTMVPSDDAAWTTAVGGTDYEISLQCCGSPGLGPWKAPGIFTGKNGTPLLRPGADGPVRQGRACRRRDGAGRPVHAGRRRSSTRPLPTTGCGPSPTPMPTRTS